MSLVELQILLDLNCDNEIAVLSKHASWVGYGYLFVNSEDGHCYLFDVNGKIDDIKKMKKLHDIKEDIKKIAIPEHIKNIGDWTFYGCRSLTSIEIPKNVKSIGDSAFRNCTSLTSIKISEGVESIEYSTFEYCTSLKSIEIPESVESIGDWAFYNCRSLKEVIFKGKTIDQVKKMKNYPWGIENEAIIKCS